MPFRLAVWVIHAAAVVLGASLASYLAVELRRTGEALEERTSDLARLQSLHQRTVESLMSGLLTTNTSGSITSFNPEAERIIKVWDVNGTTLSNGRTFTSMELDGFDQAGLADGIRCDTDGNIWSSAGGVGEGYDGVHVFAPDGDRIGQIRLPEICSNLCFGGQKRNRLFMTASQSLYAVYTEAQGAHIT